VALSRTASRRAFVAVSCLPADIRGTGFQKPIGTSPVSARAIPAMANHRSQSSGRQRPSIFVSAFGVRFSSASGHPTRNGEVEPVTRRGSLSRLTFHLPPDRLPPANDSSPTRSPLHPVSVSAGRFVALLSGSTCCCSSRSPTCSLGLAYLAAAAATVIFWLIGGYFGGHSAAGVGGPC